MVQVGAQEVGDAAKLLRAAAAWQHEPDNGSTGGGMFPHA